jgi:DNA-binding transcriptional LysR family regulator
MAAITVIAPVWKRFLSTYPDVHLELAVGEETVDIVTKGFDAGIGPQSLAARDMSAVRVTGPIKIVVVGASSYFAQKRPPRTPDDLARHTCIQFALGDGAMCEWIFERNGKSWKVPTKGQVTVNSIELAVRAAVDGLGVAYTVEAQAEPFLRSGQLVGVLEEWTPVFEGLYLYYPGHRQVPVALRALIDMVRTAHGSASGNNLLENPFAAE